jgi:hypothetical protein
MKLRSKYIATLVLLPCGFLLTALAITFGASQSISAAGWPGFLYIMGFALISINLGVQFG